MRGWKWARRTPTTFNILDQWLERYPDANWALVPVRAFVVDIDCKNESLGMESIESACGELDVSFTVRTPSGGLHVYFAPDPSVPFVTKNKWMPGVDIRYGDKGYIVLPYSKLADAGTYRIETDLEELPCGASHGPSDLHKSLLTPIPDWIKSRLLGPEPYPLKSLSKETLNTTVIVHREVSSWTDVRDRVRYMLFRNRNNILIWNRTIERGERPYSERIRMAISD